MISLKTFDFHSQNVRVVINDKNEPEFCASDVCKILGYANGPKAISDHCKSDGITKRYIIDSLGREQNASFINEGNLYRVILKSDKPEAEPFERWVCDEILPSIRKHGAYMTENVIEQAIADPDSMIRLLTNLKEERRQRQLAEQTAQLQAAELQKAAPKVEYYNEVLVADNCHTTTTIAKELGMAAKGLNHLLSQKGIIYFQDNHWVLYSKYQGMGYTKTRTHKYETIEDGKVIAKTSIHTVWTEKGREFIHRKVGNLKPANNG